MNVLDIIQAACSDIGLARPPVAVAATDTATQQMVGLLNKEGRSLARRYPWQAIQYEGGFVSTAVDLQSTLAAAGASLMQPIGDITRDTMWDRTAQQPVLGPMSAQEWQAYKATVGAVPNNCYRIRGNGILFAGTLTPGHSIYFEYSSTSWCCNSASTIFRNSINADTDLMVVNDELCLLGLIWRWKKAKGFDYAEDMTEYERQVNDKIAKDATKPRVQMAGGNLEGVGRATIPRLIGS